MDRVFPLGFPTPTAFYLVLYVVTLAVHVFFMNYVLAGAAWLAVSSLNSRFGTHHGHGVTAILRDWLPAALSAAITAGVAPLLFVQVLYKQEFYTANLLLFHRWMSILPVLIVGFYLAYLQRGPRIAQWSSPWKFIVALATFACFAYTAYSWTENHMLSLAGSPVWQETYRTESQVYFDWQMLPRLTVWALGAFPTMALIVAWQLRSVQRRGETGIDHKETHRLAVVALTFLALSVMAAVTAFATAGADTRAAVRSSLAQPCLIAGIAGVAFQAAAWAWQLRKPLLDRAPLAAATAGCTVTILSMCVVRESLRLAALDVESFYESHRRAYAIGGFAVFAIFLVLNAVLIACCIIAVRRTQRMVGDSFGGSEPEA